MGCEISKLFVELEEDIASSNLAYEDKKVVFETAKYEFMRDNLSTIPVEVLVADHKKFSKYGERKLEIMLNNEKMIGAKYKKELFELKKMYFEDTYLDPANATARFYGKTERLELAGKARILGSSENTKWSDTEFKPGDKVRVESLIEDFKATFDSLIIEDGDPITEWHDDMLDVAFESSVQLFIDAGIDIDYNFVERLNDGDYETRGVAKLDTDTIVMQYGNRKDFISPREVFLHEMQHLLVTKVLDNDLKMKRKVKRLWRAMGKNRNFDYKILLIDKPNPTQDQIDWAKKHFAYAMSNEYEFMAAATTNKYFMYALADDSGIYTPNISLLEKFNIVEIQKNNVIKGKGRTDGSTFSTKMLKVVNALIDVINQVYRKVIGVEGKAGVDQALDLLEALSSRAVATERMTKVKVKSSNKVIRAYHEAETKLSNITKKLDDDYSELERTGFLIKDRKGVGAWLDKVSNYKKLGEIKNHIIINGWVSGMKDTTAASVSWFYELFRHAKYDIDVKVTNAKNAVLVAMNKEIGWKNIPEDHGLRIAATNVLIRTDIRAFGGISMLSTLLEDDKNIEDSIAVLSKNFDKNLLKAIEKFGYKLVTGQELSVNGFKNANEIARAMKTSRPSGMKKNDFVKAIDTLSSLYALKYVGEADKQLVKNALDNDEQRKMLEQTANMYYTHLDQSNERLFANNPYNFTKGWMQNHFTERNTVNVASEEDLAALAKMKIYPINDGKKLEPMSTLTGKAYYMVSGPNLDSDYTKGLISTVGIGAEGISFRSMLLKTGYSLDEVNEFIDKMREFTDDMDIDFDVHNMVADRNIFGVVEDYKFVPTVEEQNNFLGMKNDITHVMASTIGNLTNKELSILNNMKAVTYMNKFFKDNVADHGNEFIEVRPSTKEELDAGKPYKYAYLWDAMPSYTQYYIKQSNGLEKIRVHRSMVQNFFGFKDASIVNAPIINKRYSTRLVAKVIEDSVKMFVAKFKRVVVTLFPDTVFGNASSNAAVVMQETKITPTEYASKFTEIWKALDQFVDNQNELAILDQLRAAGVDIDEEEYIRIVNDNKTNPVYDLIEDGQFTQLIEDIEFGDGDSSSFTKKKLEKLYGKLPEGVRTAKEGLYLDPKTTAYQKIVLLTTYMDIVNRAIIYHEKKGEVAKRPLLNYLDQLFVNYGYLDNKFIKWGNDTAALLFTRYTTRMMNVVIKIAKNNPLTTMFFVGTQKLANIDMPDVFDSYFSPYNTLIHKMGWTEPGNIFEAVVVPVWAQD